MTSYFCANKLQIYTKKIFFFFTESIKSRKEERCYMNSFYNCISDECCEVSVKKDNAESVLYSYPLIPLVS